MNKIKSIEITNSSFFIDGLKIDFSENLNCLMGGRGAGKSTLLYMIKSALQEGAENNKTIFDILKKNLGDGIINLIIETEAKKTYKIQKNFNDEPQLYNLPSGAFESNNNIEDLISCDIYETSKIEDIGRNPLDRLQLIDKMTLDLEIYKSKLKSKQIELDENAQTIKTENSRLKLLIDKLLNYEKIEEKFKEHQEEKPEGLEDYERKKFETADKNEKTRGAEKRFIKKVEKRLKTIEADLKEKINEIDDFVKGVSKKNEIINQDILIPFTDRVNTYFNGEIESYKKSLGSTTATLKEIKDVQEKLEEKHTIQQNEFIQLKQKFEKNKVYINTYNQLSKKVDKKKTLQIEIKEFQKKIEKSKKVREKLIPEFNVIKQSLYEERFSNISKLNQELNAIKITLTFSGITDVFEDALREGLRGSGMRYNILIPKIVNNFTPDRFAQIVHTKDRETLKKITGIDDTRSDELFKALHETENIYFIESLYCPDLPEFLLKVDAIDNDENGEQGNYRRSEELSTGQRCTTILPIIFEVSNNPLIIDQPEDNLDNRYISKTIHKIIKEQKKVRQLIFITHNPNIPVLSNSEMNVFLSYNDKKSTVENNGKVDDVKENIISLLEGGKDAFEKRRDIYGY